MRFEGLNSDGSWREFDVPWYIALLPALYWIVPLGILIGLAIGGVLS